MTKTSFKIRRNFNTRDIRELVKEDLNKKRCNRIRAYMGGFHPFIPQYILFILIHFHGYMHLSNKIIN